MPIREYYCPQCDAEFEELVSGDTIPPCPMCGAGGSQPLMSCCCVRGASGEYGAYGDMGGGGGGGCAGCSGGSCASCH